MKIFLFVCIVFICVACSKSDDGGANNNMEASKLRPTRVLVSDFSSGSGIYKTIEYTYNSKDLPVLVTIYDATFVNGIYTNTDLYASMTLTYALDTNNLERMNFDFPDFEFRTSELNFIYALNGSRITGVNQKRMTNNGVLSNWTQQFTWIEEDMRYNYVYHPADGFLFLKFDDDFNLVARNIGTAGNGSYQVYYDYDNSAPIFFHDLDNAKNLNEMFSFIDTDLGYFNFTTLKYLGIRYPVNLEDALREQQTTVFNDKGFVTKYFVDSSLSYDIEYESFE